MAESVRLGIGNRPARVRTRNVYRAGRGRVPRSAQALPTSPAAARASRSPRSRESRPTTHPRVRVEPGDMVVLSSRFIPGNERSIDTLVNRLYKSGAEVMYESVAPVHVSGHASQDELAEMIALTRAGIFRSDSWRVSSSEPPSRAGDRGRSAGAQLFPARGRRHPDARRRRRASRSRGRSWARRDRRRRARRSGAGRRAPHARARRHGHRRARGLGENRPNRRRSGIWCRAAWSAATAPRRICAAPAKSLPRVLARIADR